MVHRDLSAANSTLSSWPNPFQCGSGSDNEDDTAALAGVGSHPMAIPKSASMPARCLNLSIAASVAADIHVPQSLSAEGGYRIHPIGQGIIDPNPYNQGSSPPHHKSKTTNGKIPKDMGQCGDSAHGAGSMSLSMQKMLRSPMGLDSRQGDSNAPDGTRMVSPRLSMKEPNPFLQHQ